MTRRNERGSAMVMALVVILVLAAMAATLLTEVAFRQRTTHESHENDEAMIIARTGLERARRALYLYRADRTWDPSVPVAPGAVAGDYLDQWNDILAYCGSGNPLTSSADPELNKYFPPSGTPLKQTLEDIRAHYEIVRTNSQFTSYRTRRDADNASVTYNLPDPFSNAEAPPRLDSTGQPEPRVLFGACKPFRGGAYHVLLSDNDDGDADPLTDSDRTLVCTVTSILEDGTLRQIEALVFYTPPNWIPAQALLSGGDLVMEGNPSVLGASGSIFANGDLTFSGGNVEISQTYGAAGNITGAPASGAPLNGVGGNQPPVEIPEIDPDGYWNVDATNTYYLNADGTITGPGGFTFDGSGGVKWEGFQFNNDPTDGVPDGWSLSGNRNPPQNKIYAIASDFTMTGMGALAPLTATFLVKGHADMGGNREIRPFWENVSLLAARDLVLRGTSGNVGYQGLFAAHEQVLFQGTASIFGSIIAENAPSTGSPPAHAAGMPVDGMKVGGTPDVEYDGGLVTPVVVDSSVSIRGMRRTYPGP
ncbi:MAG: hypothetical protein HYY16_00845 [Planctomycetes bacterium]|nr:hypothetical protein [Planctomycetota bacterium]